MKVPVPVVSDQSPCPVLVLKEIVDIVERSRGFDAVAPDLLGVQLEEWFGAHFRTHDARLHAVRP